jgi:hypothetical protein
MGHVENLLAYNLTFAAEQESGLPSLRFISVASIGFLKPIMPVVSYSKACASDFSRLGLIGVITAGFLFRNSKSGWEVQLATTLW